MKIFEHLQKPWFLDVNSNLFFIKIKDKWRDKNNHFEPLFQKVTTIPYRSGQVGTKTPYFSPACQS